MRATVEKPFECEGKQFRSGIVQQSDFIADHWDWLTRHGYLTVVVTESPVMTAVKTDTVPAPVPVVPEVVVQAKGKVASPKK